VRKRTAAVERPRLHPSLTRLLEALAVPVHARPLGGPGVPVQCPSCARRMMSLEFVHHECGKGTTASVYRCIEQIDGTFNKVSELANR